MSLRTAIWDQLQASAELDALVGDRIYHAVAPAKAAYPLVIFHQQSGEPIRVVNGTLIGRDAMWLVKGVDGPRADQTSGLPGVVEEIDAAIEAALHDQTLTVDGEQTVDVARASDVVYAQPEDGALFLHRGALYAIKT